MHSSVSPSHSAIPTQASVVPIWRKRNRRKEAKGGGADDGGLGSGDGGLSMHAEPQIYLPRLGLRTSHTHTNTYIPTRPSPETPPPGPVVFLYQVGLSTSQTAPITSHAPIAWVPLQWGLNGYIVFRNAAIAAWADMFAVRQPATNFLQLSLLLSFMATEPPACRGRHTGSCSFTSHDKALLDCHFNVIRNANYWL